MSREIPIIFNGDMVRAILSGQKTQTRRPVKAQPHGVGSWVKHGDKWAFPNVNPYCSARCPFGLPGDLLWVRESAEVLAVRSGGLREIDIRYMADGSIATVPYPSRLAPAPLGKKLANGTYREASRIPLRVTAVRVERVQDISEQDAWAEGCEGWDDDVTGGSTGFGEFAGLWDRIYGNWDTNPWVWVIEFERVTDSNQEAA